MPRLLLGPMLRYVDDARATVWVETDGAATVEVLGRSAQTVEVEGHHYALVTVDGLAPGGTTAYDVRLDGRRVWPEPDCPLPTPVVRTLDPARPLRVVVASCRRLGPDPRRLGPDALRALAREVAGGAAAPDLLVLVGDQIYADKPPPGVPAARDYAGYARIYRHAWSDPDVRWLLSTVPSATVLDDHEVLPSWNCSADWVQRLHRRRSWREQLTGALTAYAVYQHLGNLDPAALGEWLADIRGGELAARVRDASWCHARELPHARLVTLDVRGGRRLDERDRSMLAERDWAWLDRQLTGDVDHLLVVSSLPVLLLPAIAHGEAWAEALCAGRWGSAFALLGRLLRQLLGLEHWPAFGASFRRLAALTARVATGERGRAPATVLWLSGDVHYGYLAAASLDSSLDFSLDAQRSRIWQVVSSPLRNHLPLPSKLLNRFGTTRLALASGSLLRWLAALPPFPVRWRVADGPVFGNQLAELTLVGSRADVVLRGVGRDGSLTPLLGRRL
ncbi:MAG TPA: alkaline phosphatase D family protein [Mycobacteriales bacterium]|nr:alkaline phosphatase D family protein [Mycobacteriales bacterium]